MQGNLSKYEVGILGRICVESNDIIACLRNIELKSLLNATRERLACAGTDIDGRRVCLRSYRLPVKLLNGYGNGCKLGFVPVA